MGVCGSGGLCITRTDAKPVRLVKDVTGHRKLVTKTANAKGAIALRILTRAFSRTKIPYFVTSVGNSLSNVSRAKGLDKFVRGHYIRFNVSTTSLPFRKYPIQFCSICNRRKRPVHAAVTGVKTVLLTHLLRLGSARAKILALAFHVTRSRRVPLISVRSLHLVLSCMTGGDRHCTAACNGISATAVNTVRHTLLALLSRKTSEFFNRPTFSVFSLLRARRKHNMVGVLTTSGLVLRPGLCSACLL